MAATFPGLEGIDFEGLRSMDAVFRSESEVYLKYIIARAAAIAIESEIDGTEPTESSWVSILPRVDKIRREGFERGSEGGDIYLSTLFVLLSCVLDGEAPNAFNDLASYVEQRAFSEEVGKLVMLGFEPYRVNEGFWEKYFKTILTSLDQRNCVEAIKAAMDSIPFDRDEEGFSRDEYNLEEYLKLVSSKESLIESLDEAIYNDVRELCITYQDESIESEHLLISALLDAGDNDSVACFGRGMMQSFGGDPAVRYCDDWKTVAITQLLGVRTLSNFNPDKLEDICARPLDVAGNERFDRIAWDFPLGFRTSALEGESAALKRCKQGMPEYGRALSADWTYARIAMESLNDGGRAVLHVSDGALMNGADVRIRRFFIDNGWVEGVVSLPDDGEIKRSLLILSHGNDAVRFVDAGQKPGWQHNSGDEDGEKHPYAGLNSSYTIDLYFNCDDPKFDGGWEEFGERRAMYVPSEKLDDYLLNVGRYLQAELMLEDPVALGDVAVKLGRGTSLTAKDIRLLATPFETNVKYLALSDVRDGRAGRGLQSLEELDDREKAHCAYTGDVLISRNEPLNVMVAEVPEGQTLLVNGNMYIVRLNADLINPYYAAAFLSSRLGQEVIRRLLVGTKLKTLPRKKLEKIQIPLIPLEDQNRIAIEYQARLDGIEVLNLRIERMREEILMAFSEER